MKPYRTLLKPGLEEYVINKSRFIGQAVPVSSADSALEFLNSVREKMRDANHHCYAYIIGENAGIMRYSDDGEPAGTAGLPIMEVLKNRGVVNCAVVVTRYFGGILLGAGGLVRAYSHSCVLALNSAGICVMQPTEHWLCEVPYPLWDKVQYSLKYLPVRCSNISFGTAVSFEYDVKTGDSSSVEYALIQTTAAQIEMLKEKEEYSAWLEVPSGDTSE